MTKEQFLSLATAFMKNVYASHDIGGDLYGISHERYPTLFVQEPQRKANDLNCMVEDSKPRKPVKSASKAKKPAKPVYQPNAFVCRVKVGGRRGGSCYGTEATEYTVTPEYHSLDHMLALFISQHFDNFPFLSFQAIKAKVRMEESSESEYYGNRIDYAMYRLLFEDMWPEVERHLERESKKVNELLELQQRLAKVETLVQKLTPLE